MPHRTHLLDELLGGETDLAFYVRDSSLRLVRANPAFAALCGQRTVAAIIGRSNAELFPAQLAEEYTQAEEAVLATGSRSELVTLFPDSRGIPAWSRVIRCPLRGSAGKITGIVGIVRGFEEMRTALEPYAAIAPAVDAMQRNYRRPLHLPELAGMINLSVRQFERRFLSLFGTTPQQYTLRIRIITGCELLAATDLPVAEIATRIGFCDHSGFTRHFTRLVGQPPLKYRQARRQL